MSPIKLTHDRLIALLKAYLTSMNGGAPMSPFDLAELREWSEQSPENHALFDRISESGHLPAAFEQMAFFEGRVEAAIARMHARQTAPRFHTGLRLLSWMAAASLFGLSLFLYLQYRHPVSLPSASPAIARQDVDPGGNKAVLTLGNGRRIVLDSASTGILAEEGATKIIHESNGIIAYHNTVPSIGLSNTVTTPQGGQYKVILPDGTQVWLNAASSITFPSAFTGAMREVYLQGEGYFDVAPVPSRPFIVHTSLSTIQVLGTRFDVSTYSDDPTQKLTLVNGAVRIRTGNKEKQLRPGEQASSSADGDLTLALTDIDQVTAWKDGMFSFDHKDLYTAMREIARWYDVKIVYQGNVPNRKLFGYLPRDTKLSTILNLLSQVRIHCRMVDRAIYVTP